MHFNSFRYIKNITLIVPCMVLYMTTSMAGGHIGADISLSNETGNFAVYSLRERSQEVTNVGVEFFFNEPKDNFANIFGSINRKSVGSNNLELGVKGKIFYVKQGRNNQSGEGLMVGLMSRYWFPAEAPVSLAVEALYSPPIVSFHDVKNAFNFTTKLELRILPSAVAYIGFRALVVDFDGQNNHELDKNLNLGIHIALR
jgi:hypothetical protein